MNSMKDLFGEAFKPIPLKDIEKEKKKFEPIPEGIYKALIIDTIFKPTRRGDGTILAITFKIIENGEYHGRKIFDNLNIKNPSAVAQNIAKEKLSYLCNAIGMPELDDIALLIDKKLEIGLTIEPAKDGWEAKNKVISYESSAIDPVRTLPEPSIEDDDLPF